jgi:kynurenine formamidase
MMRIAALFLVCLLPGCATGPALTSGTVVDLTHTFDSGTIYWPTEPLFKHALYAEGMTERRYWYAAGRLATAEHGGTHIDAPYHFWEDGAKVDAIPLERLIGPGVVVDVSASCAEDRDYLVTVDDFRRWEERNGRIPEGAIVLLKTGFGAYWPDRERYMGTAERGTEAVPKLHFPGLHPDAARWIATERTIAVIGLDTPSIDHGPSKEFASHVALFEHGIPALENVANLDRLPEKGFTVIALPMKIRGATGGPTRIVALLDS